MLLVLASLLLSSQLPFGQAAPLPAPAPAPAPLPAPAALPAPFVPPFNLFIRLLGGLGGGAAEEESGHGAGAVQLILAITNIVYSILFRAVMGDSTMV